MLGCFGDGFELRLHSMGLLLPCREKDISDPFVNGLAMPASDGLEVIVLLFGKGDLKIDVHGFMVESMFTGVNDVLEF